MTLALRLAVHIACQVGPGDDARRRGDLERAVNDAFERVGVAESVSHVDYDALPGNRSFSHPVGLTMSRGMVRLVDPQAPARTVMVPWGVDGGLPSRTGFRFALALVAGEGATLTTLTGVVTLDAGRIAEGRSSLVLCVRSEAGELTAIRAATRTRPFDRAIAQAMGDPTSRGAAMDEPKALIPEDLYPRGMSYDTVLAGVVAAHAEALGTAMAPARLARMLTTAAEERGGLLVAWPAALPVYGDWQRLRRPPNDDPDSPLDGWGLYTNVPVSLPPSLRDDND